MATVSKLLIRLQKFSSKISTVVDATDSFSANNNYYQDLSGWDSAVVQVVGLTGSIDFSTTNDDGAITGQLLPAPEVPINWVSVLGVDLTTKTDVSSVSADGIVEFGIIGKYLLLQGDAITTTTAAPTTTTTTSGSLYDAVPVYVGTTTFDACTNGGTPNGTFYVASGAPIMAGTIVYENSSLTTPAAGYNALMFNGVPPVFNTDEAGVLVFVNDCA
jgi:hypothetical protein